MLCRWKNYFLLLDNFGLINQFSLNLQGTISSIIITNKVSYIKISYKTETSNTKNYSYHYYIYPPKCYGISITINSFGKFQKDLFNIFKRETNTQYKIRFNNLPSNYGVIKIGNKEISSTSEIVDLNSDMEKLYFISNNYEGIINYKLNFNISIIETYSSVCAITLTIKSCYNSCKGCLNDIDSADDNNHYCIECKEGFYPSPKKEGNCYTRDYLEEEYPAHYLDEVNKIFITCNPKCNICKDPINEFCIICCKENCTEEYDPNDCKVKSYGRISSSDFKQLLLTNITSFMNSSALYNGSDFKAVVLSSDEMDPNEQVKKGISAIDIGNCTAQIKEYYNISKDENLIILNIENKRNETKINEEKTGNLIDIGKQSYIGIYDNTGRKLSMSVCQEDVKILRYIGDLREKLKKVFLLLI